MPTPFRSRQATQSSWPTGAKPKPTISQNSDWRCTRCEKLLGVCRDGRMHLRFARGHEYFVGFPVQATCRGCGTLNQASSLRIPRKMGIDSTRSWALVPRHLGQPFHAKMGS